MADMTSEEREIAYQERESHARYEYAVAQIIQAKREGWTELDLSDLRLPKLPPIIRHLTKLQSLSLNNNGLVAVPDFLRKLKQLQFLNFGSNMLTAVPDWLGELASLQFQPFNNPSKLLT